MQLRILFDRFVLSICKCRPRLAHKQCFNNYIDSKQNGNVNILVTCIQCNLKYEFIYPYNGNNTFKKERKMKFKIDLFIYFSKESS